LDHTEELTTNRVPYADSMGIAETYSRGRRLATQNPVGVVVAATAVVLALDLLGALATGGVAVSRVGRLVWDGLMRGLVIGLAGIGLSMTYSILGFANFAHGDYTTSGAFAGWAATYLLAGLGRADVGSLLLVGAGGSVFGAQLGVGVVATPLAVVAGLLTAGVGAVVLALAVDRVVFRPLRGESGIALLITSIGVAFALRNLLQFVFGPARRGTTDAGAVPDVEIPLVDGVVTVGAHDITLLVVASGLMLGVHFLLQRTKLGKAMRAMSDNRDLARVTGIPTERVVTATWVIGAALTGAAGYVLVLWKGTMTFNDGWLLLLLIFAAVILGGIGSIYGAIVGGLVIGLTASLAAVWIPASFARAAAFVVMIVVLLVRPTGIFGGRSTA
jgi:amino acid/amide ABC transporter membrane protein 1, HAAT family (TC 3.A.1.4.-)